MLRQDSVVIESEYSQAFALGLGFSQANKALQFATLSWVIVQIWLIPLFASNWMRVSGVARVPKHNLMGKAQAQSGFHGF